MTQRAFLAFNAGLSLLPDLCKEDALSKNDAAKNYAIGFSNLLLGDPALFSIMSGPESRFAIPKVNNPSDHAVFSPYIIYTGGQSGKRFALSVTDFVAQFFQPDFGGCLLLFDMNESPYPVKENDKNKSGTRKHPHYAIYDGTFMMLDHDMAHYIDQLKNEGFLMYHGIAWRDELYKINDMREALLKREPNTAKILEYALFLFSHELPNISSESDGAAGPRFYHINPSGPSKFANIFRPDPQATPTFFDAVRAIAESMKGSTIKGTGGILNSS